MLGTYVCPGKEVPATFNQLFQQNRSTCWLQRSWTEILARMGAYLMWIGHLITLVNLIRVVFVFFRSLAKCWQIATWTYFQALDPIFSKISIRLSRGQGALTTKARLDARLWRYLQQVCYTTGFYNKGYFMRFMSHRQPACILVFHHSSRIDHNITE